MRIIWLFFFWLVAAPVAAQQSVSVWYVHEADMYPPHVPQRLSGTPVSYLATRHTWWLKNNLRTDSIAGQAGVRVTALGAYELFWDGVRIGTSGQVGVSAETEVPGAINGCFFLPDSLAGPGIHRIALRVSNYHLPKNTSWFVVSAGNYQDLLLGPVLPAVVMHTLAGLFLAASLYFLFAANRQDPSYALFSGICGLFFALIVLEYLRRYYFYPYPFQYLRLDLIQGLLLALCLLVPVFFALNFLPGKVPYVLGGQLLVLILLSFVFWGRYDRLAMAGVATLFVTSTGLASRASVRSPEARFVTATLLVTGIQAALLPFDYSLFIGFSLLIICQFFLLSRRMKQQRRASEEARLLSTRLQTELLRKQIQPHYLLNTLTCLAEFVEESPPKGVGLIFALSREFELFFRFVQKTRVPVREEIDLCRRHLDVMQFRLETSFFWMEEGILPDETLPPAILHTLVENGITHCRPVRGFRLSFRKENRIKEYVLITEGAPVHAFGQEGTGTRYLKARLTESYGHQWAYHSNPVPAGWENRILLYENSDR